MTLNSEQHISGSTDPVRWDLAAESIVARIRWFGLCIGYVLVNLMGRETDQPVLNAVLTLGVIFALVDTWWRVRGQVFLKEMPLLFATLEAIYIGVLCHFDEGVNSPFRFYYFLSVLICAMRHPIWTAYATFALHAISYTVLVFVGPILAPGDLISFLLTETFLIWVTWASTELAGLIKMATRRLSELNDELQENQTLLEERIQDRTLELQESQAMLVQQEKQAAFGLLAAGIAHEVGNPLAAISSLVQMLNRKQIDDHTRAQLQLVDDQLRRIQSILRELLDFSRPTNTEKKMCDVHEMIDSSLSIAKYYKRKKGKKIITRYDKSLPQLRVVRDRLVQVFLNLILNALDATEEGTEISIATGFASTGQLFVRVTDRGHGISPEHQARLFQPYFTTKSEGTGLGLFVCRNIVREEGGQLELTESSSAGTTFTLTLPLVDDTNDERGDKENELSFGSVASLPEPVERSSSE